MNERPPSPPDREPNFLDRFFDRLNDIIPEGVLDKFDEKFLELVAHIRSLPRTIFTSRHDEAGERHATQVEQQKAEAAKRAYNVLLTRLTVAGLTSITGTVIALAKAVSEYPESKRAAEVWLMAGGMGGIITSAVALVAWYVVEKSKTSGR